MIKPIVVYGSPILRQTCLPYNIGTDVSEITEDLFDTMYNAKGAGLAATQINQEFRIFVVDLPDLNWKKVFINPVISEYKGEDVVMNEGCLSIPKVSGPVKRKSEIVIEYYDEDWLFNKEEFDGIKARVIQHEYDHLQGVLWVDKMEKMSARDMLIIMTALQHSKTKTSNPDYLII